MPNVTVQAGSTVATLTYNVSDRAYTVAQSVAASINSTYHGNGTSYNPSNYNNTGNGGYLYSLNNNGSAVGAVGYQSVVVQNTADTYVLAGGNASQVVIGSNAGLNVSDQNDSAGHSTTVVAGGGNNYVSFSGDLGAEAAYFANGNNQIFGGNGSTTIVAGTGNNYEALGGGTSSVTVDGHDTVALGAGSATITVDSGATAVVNGSYNTSVSGVSLVFANADGASTVNGGNGTYSINGGAGGGVYFGGNGGHNTITGGTGSVTLYGGGTGDSLTGGSAGNNVFYAGSSSNSTLVASAGGNDVFYNASGADTLSFVNEAGGKLYTVYSYSSSDKIELNAAGYSSEHQTVANGATTITLGDSTKITLIGYTGSVSLFHN